MEGKTESTNFLLKLPRQMHTDILSHAQSNDLSMTAWIKIAIKDKFEVIRTKSTGDRK
jgi:alpha-D-ribose 1-methylphosphonate 5-triphosphate synthase subunit PhnG